jgi:hypothetical protein
MKDEHMLMLVLVFVLGFMVARMMGDRLVEGSGPDPSDYSKHCNILDEKVTSSGKLDEEDWCCKNEQCKSPLKCRLATHGLVGAPAETGLFMGMTYRKCKN